MYIFITNNNRATTSQIIISTNDHLRWSLRTGNQFEKSIDDECERLCFLVGQKSRTEVVGDVEVFTEMDGHYLYYNIVANSPASDPNPPSNAPSNSPSKPLVSSPSISSALSPSGLPN